MNTPIAQSAKLSAILQKISSLVLKLLDIVIIHLSTKPTPSRPQRTLERFSPKNYFYAKISPKNRPPNHIFCIFAVQTGPFWAISRLRIIGNTVRIRDNTCCCEFHSARNHSLWMHSLPLAKCWEGAPEGTSQKTYPLHLKIYDLQDYGAESKLILSV